MKKKICILICTMVLVATVGTFAADQIAENIAFNNMSKFDQMVSVLNKSIEDDAEFNVTLLNYKYLEYGYKVPAENMYYIADLIIDGYDSDNVIECAYFWLDTSEDISIIKEMCDWKIKNTDYQGPFWIENAFNGVTDNGCGVLDIEAFEEYVKEGITDDKILIADRLSRKGVYTIQEILKKYSEGSTMTDIAIEIDEQANWAENLNITPVYNTTNTVMEYPKIKDSEIFESRELAALYNVPELAYYDTTDSETDIETAVNDAAEMLEEEIRNELKEGNYFRRRETEAN